ncbi:MAG TPA: enoyl-ACP reductase [Candidatus Thermoplasmatota archaeon]|nr:enoyl-ACP reductase [Candidatus Thermoplasmatota archaeon]
MLNLNGKRALIFGVASDDSIAWAIAQRLAENGCKITLGYQKRFLSRLMMLVKDKPWIESWVECDVTVEEDVKKFFSQVQGKFDILVHAIAFAPATALSRPIIFTSAEDFATAMNVSAYSLVRLTHYAMPVLNKNNSIVTLTYLGGERVVPGYRVMGTAKAALENLVRELAMAIGPAGHRVNAISAGPIKTLAASGVPGFDNILDWMRMNTPLRRNVTQDDVAKASLFLLSDLATGVTGHILYVDAGYNITGAPPDLEQLAGAMKAANPNPPAMH